MSDYLTLAQASRELSSNGNPVSYWKLWSAANQGKIPVVSIAGRNLIKRDDLPKVADTFAPVEQ